MSSTETRIDRDQLSYLIAEFERKKARRQLEAVYAKIPANDCQRCGDCCFNSAQVLMVEFLSIHQHILELPPDRQRLLAERNLRHEFLNMVTLDYKCPFLEEDKSCAVYEVRPAQCRFFGLYPEREYEEMRKAGLSHNRDLAIFYARNHRVLLPEEVMTYDVQQCKNNVDADGIPHVVGRAERDLLYTQLLSVQGRTVPDWATFDDGTVRYSYVFAQLHMEPKELERLHVEVMKEFSRDGSSRQLDDIVASVLAELDPAEVLSLHSAKAPK